MRHTTTTSLTPRALALSAVSVSLFIGLFAFTAGAHAAAPPQLWQKCPSGHGAGQCEIPRGVAADPDSGHVYVADQNNNRIDEFTAWGEFVKAWGWDVVATGPGDDVSAPEDQFEICVPTDGDVCKGGAEGIDAGAFKNPQGLALDSAGNVYVVDLNNGRVQKFSSEGQFLLSWGGDVVAHGPDNSTNDEQQQLSVAASEGSFKLEFKNPFTGGEIAETGSLPFNATHEEVQAALDGLSTIGGLGGSVSVSGGAGDPTGSSPYAVTFEGNLGGDDVPQLILDRSDLGSAAIGSTLRCSTTTPAPSIAYQWLRNGVQIAGVESATYTTIAADKGKAIQCQVTAKNASSGSAQAANPVYVGPPEPAIASPVAPNGMVAEKEFGTFLTVGGPGGQKLTCNPDQSSWVGAESFTYQWYRNGDPIAGATASTRITTAADVKTPASFQCAVTASNIGGTATTKFSHRKLSSTAETYPPPVPSAPEAPSNGAGIADATMEPPSNVFTSHQGGAPEVCKAVDTCKAANVGAGNGQFGAWPVSSFIAIGADDKVYVGDVGRIQRFDTSGSYQGEIAFPSETISSLAVDPVSGDLYATYISTSGLRLPKPNIHRFSPTGAELGVVEVAEPSALAVDAAGNLHVVDGFTGVGDSKRRILTFDPAGNLTEGFDADGVMGSTGIAVNTVTGAGGLDVYISNLTGTSHFVRAYGAVPDKWPPPAAAPSVDATYALSVASDSAVVRAQINAHFWTDAHYYVQYGAADCSLGGCSEQPVAPGSLLGTQAQDADVTTAGVVLTGLQPDTTYHYRFVTSSSGGGPSFGADHAFTTFPLPTGPASECPNQAVRGGASAGLPDCRAYEMVSPVDKNGADATALSGPLNTLNQSTPSGARLTYSAAGSFAERESNPGTSQYLAERDPAAGWSTRSIDPPRLSLSLVRPPLGRSMFYAFSPDLCNGWILQDTDLALAEGAPPGFVNFYRRPGLHEGCGEAGYELLTTVKPENVGSLYFPIIDAFSADAGLSVFAADGTLTGNAAAGSEYQIYAASTSDPLRLLSVLPGGNAASGASVLGSRLGAGSQLEGNVRHALSDNGSRAFWTGKGDKLYLRLNPTQPPSPISAGKCTQPARACTVAVSQVVSENPAFFVTADPSGSTAIFSIGSNLYEFDADKAIAYEAGAATLIAGGLPSAFGAASVLDTSEDASRIYFASTQDLGAGPNPVGDLAVPGQPNLYLYERGQGFAFIGTLLAGENDTQPNPVGLLPTVRGARVSPNGMHAVFPSRAQLTGYDNVDAQSGRPDSELFLYDAATGGGEARLRCISCNPSGARPAGRRFAGGNNGAPDLWAAAYIPGWQSKFQPTRAISEDGRRVFFESFDSLVLADTNSAEDVYQWEAPGSGDCSSESNDYFHANGGCVSLISSGQSAVDAEFLDASADGSDVFFNTGSSLLPQDPGLVDVYDARAGGGFPQPPAPPAACDGEACQGPLSPPDDPTPASSSYEGAGNVVEAGHVAVCAKGKVHRKGRCVAKKRKRSKHHRRAGR